jgi:hypothetical protein
MSLGFVPGAKRGQHYDMAMSAINQLKTVDLLVRGRAENLFERSIVAYLQASPTLSKHLHTQVGMDQKETVSKASLFSFSHRPDVAIGKDGTAIEIKIITSSQDIRSVLGQAIAYRMYYRFVILVLVDQTEDRKIVELCCSKESQECNLLSGLAEAMNIFTVIGPVSKSENFAFYATQHMPVPDIPKSTPDDHRSI